jgi:hypothetical protein
LKNKIALVVIGLGILLSFQNCSSGFNANDLAGSAASGLAAGASLGSLPVVLYSAQISELQSVTVKLDGQGALTFPEGLPEGALYDEGARRINWIPRQGQAGDYKVHVLELGQEKGYVNLSVGANSAQLLRDGGPPFLYQDGEVGYVFIHGAGETDRCADSADLAAYWGDGPSIIAPDPATRYVACYDSRSAVADVAQSVAQQILNANCGRYNKCIIITHSMGGLMMEHMFLHIREPQATDPEPNMYLPRATYKAVRDRTLFVISLSSAAGGSPSASIVNNSGPTNLDQKVVGAISRFIGLNRDSTRNLVVTYASDVVAPYTEDPGVPFFMVATFSEKTLVEENGFLGSLVNVAIDSVPQIVFNGDREMAITDTLTSFQSRSDGLVDFRSSCGIASDNETDGPGRSVSLDEHFRYCWQSTKKANHFVWFLANVNHSLVTSNYQGCTNSQVPCVALFSDPANATFKMNTLFTGWSAVQVIRNRLTVPLSSMAPRVLAAR